jgi:aspartyl aminopeptidase
MILAMTDAARDLIDFIDRSPTPYHAVAEVKRRLMNAGYSALSEQDRWAVAAGDRRYVVRGDGSILAFQLGSQAPAEAGFHVIGAHTDSPNLRIKPSADVTAHGYRQLAVEPYGGLLLHTWLDRDLSLAGRVTFETDSGLRTCLVDFERPLLRVPNLAIHLFRELREQGLKLNAQQHAVPLLGLADAPPLHEMLAAELARTGEAGVAAGAIHGFDLMTYDVQGATLAGVDEAFVNAARLDNLASCHAAITALLADDSLPAFTRVVVLYDHEEVGSRSAQGAAGSFLEASLARLSAASGDAKGEDMARAISRSFLVSADMAHAVHPNYADRHEPGHRPQIGAGPVIKINANQSYASDASTVAHFTALCRSLGVDPQSFVTRSDLGCGSTIGPITAARLGMRTVDVGNPMLSMHSCREMAGRADIEPMIRVLSAFLDRPIQES